MAARPERREPQPPSSDLQNTTRPAMRARRRIDCSDEERSADDAASKSPKQRTTHASAKRGHSA
jgi:hypothetical protein